MYLSRGKLVNKDKDIWLDKAGRTEHTSNMQQMISIPDRDNSSRPPTIFTMSLVLRATTHLLLQNPLYLPTGGLALAISLSSNLEIDFSPIKTASMDPPNSSPDHIPKRMQIP